MSENGMRNELRKVLREKLPYIPALPSTSHLLLSLVFIHTTMAVSEHAFLIVAGVQYLFIVIGIPIHWFPNCAYFISDDFVDCGGGKSEQPSRSGNRLFQWV
jgi:hypothetical protein